MSKSNTCLMFSLLKRRDLLEFYNLTSVPLLGIKNNASLMALSTVAFNSVMKSMIKTKIQCNFFLC